MNRLDVGKCFRIAQVKKGVSNRQLMDDFEVHRQQVHRWRHARSMSTQKVEEFANYFGMNVFYFLKLGDRYEGLDTSNN